MIKEKRSQCIIQQVFIGSLLCKMGMVPGVRNITRNNIILSFEVLKLANEADTAHCNEESTGGGGAQRTVGSRTTCGVEDTLRKGCQGQWAG